MPSRLGRFLYHNARPAEKQALLSLASSTGSQTAPIIGYKRLDPLTGITIGKRSPILDGKSMEFVNWEPVFNRQFGLHSPRLYDLHWASAEPSLEVSNGNQAE